MRLRRWWLHALSFAILLGMFGSSGYWTMRRARLIHDEMKQVHVDYLRTDAFLQGLTEDMYVGGLLVRDYLLDSSSDANAVHLQRLEKLRGSVERGLQGLERALGAEETPELRRLQGEVKAYWDSIQPIFEWTPEQKRALGPQFLQRNVLPRWNTVLTLADKLTKLNQDNLDKDQLRLEASQDSFQRFLGKMLTFTLVLGLVVATVATQGLVQLEQKNDSHRRKAEYAEQVLRQLSRRVVRAQEDERKFIARELHDAAGQTLTAVGMELSRLELLRTSPNEFTEHVNEIKRLNNESLTVLRDLAMGLRPSMLDDIGLGPALEWQGRQVSRSSSIPVTVQVTGDQDGLPEAHRTCVYRAVQEALTNCVRHAHASQIRVAVDLQPGSITATIEDNGVGFSIKEGPRTGIGLVGIRERIEELGGRVNLVTAKGKGTKLTLNVPLMQG